MSADNYNLVRKNKNGGFDVWLNLSASCDEDEQIVTTRPARNFVNEISAVEWADAQGYAEYGTHVYEEPMEPEILATYRAASHAVHRLWTERVGTFGYNKADWQELANAVDKLGRDAATLAGWPKDKSMLTAPPATEP